MGQEPQGATGSYRGKDRVGGAYNTLPWQVVGFESTAIERDEDVRAAVSVGQREFRLSHLLAGSSCGQISRC